MQLLQASCPASKLALLFFLIPLNALCATIKPPHDVHIATSPRVIRGEEHPILPSAQPPTNTTTSTPPLYTIHLLNLRTIFTSPETEQHVFRALERTCEAFAYFLLDYDFLDEQDLVLRFGDFTLEFYDVAEHLSMLAVKTVVMKLMQMITMGLLGFVNGEMVDAQAGVRIIFAFGILGGGYEN